MKTAVQKLISDLENQNKIFLEQYNNSKGKDKEKWVHAMSVQTNAVILAKKYIESETQSPEPMRADMTAAEYFDGEGSPLTLSKICSPEEKEFLLSHIELYAKGKVYQALKAQHQSEGEKSTES